MTRACAIVVVALAVGCRGPSAPTAVPPSAAARATDAASPPADAAMAAIRAPAVAADEAVAPDCGDEGDTRTDRPCCPGEVRIEGLLGVDGTCDADPALAAVRGGWCSPCGDGTCDTLEDRCSCPADCKPSTARPSITYRGAPVPPRQPRTSVLQNPVAAGNVMAVADAVDAAVAAHDRAACRRLPAAEVVVLNHGDHWTQTPTDAAWRVFCEAMIAGDRRACEAVASGGTPNLHAECVHYADARMAEARTDPGQCLNEPGVDANRADLCLKPYMEAAYGPGRLPIELAVAVPVPPVTRRLLDVYMCLELESADPDTPPELERDRCLHALALRTRDATLCALIDDPGPPRAVPTAGGPVRDSQATCRDALR